MGSNLELWKALTLICRYLQRATSELTLDCQKDLESEEMIGR